MKEEKSLTRRERQIMDIVYELNQATVAQVLERIPNPPHYSTIRALLRVLEEKGHLKHKQDGPRYVYSPTLPREVASQNALKHIKKIFFDDSIEDVVAALLNISEANLTKEEYKRLSDLIKETRKEGR